MKIKALIVGVTLLSYAGVAISATKEEELAAAKNAYTANVNTVKTNYAAQIDPIKTQISTLTAQKSVLTQQKKSLTDSRKASRAAIAEEFKSRRQTECKDPKTAGRTAAAATYSAAKTSCAGTYPKYLGKDADGENIPNPDFTACVDAARGARDTEYARLAGVYTSCVEGMNATRQAAYSGFDDSTGWSSAVSQIAELNAQIAPLREQAGALKDAMNAEVEPLKTSYDEAVAAIEAKYAEAPVSEPSPTPAPAPAPEPTPEPAPAPAPAPEPTPEPAPVPECTYTADRGYMELQNGEPYARFWVTAGSGCSWRAIPTDYWLLPAIPGGTGSGVAMFNVVPNSTGSPRKAVVILSDGAGRQVGQVIISQLP